VGIKVRIALPCRANGYDTLSFIKIISVICKNMLDGFSHCQTLSISAVIGSKVFARVSGKINHF
jgi:hypothetical protein